MAADQPQKIFAPKSIRGFLRVFAGLFLYLFQADSRPIRLELIGMTTRKNARKRAKTTAKATRTKDENEDQSL
jgi:hypothetical protein